MGTRRLKPAFLLVVGSLLLAAPIANAQLGSTSGNTTVTVTVAAEAALTVSSPTALTSTGANFSTYTSVTPTTVTYFVRTSQAGGSGSITLKVTGDFTPANGPSVLTPPTAGDALKYTCGVTGTGTACSGSQTASTTASTPVVSYNADAHTTTFPGGDTATTTWSLTNDPKYKTGTYTATVTFTISAS